MAVELALEARRRPGRVSEQHVINVLARLNAPPRPANVETLLQVLTPPIIDTARYDRLRNLQEVDHGVRVTSLPTLRRCVCTAWRPPGPNSSINAAARSKRLGWVVEQMMRAETTDRATRSVSHQMNAAHFPAHRDLARLRLRDLAGGRSW